MIRCDFFLQTGDNPSEWVHLDCVEMDAVPAVGWLIGPGEQAARWTQKHDPSSALVLLWRVTSVAQYLRQGNVLVAVIPCVAIQKEDKSNE